MDLEFWIMAGTLALALLAVGLGMAVNASLHRGPAVPPALPLGPGFGGWRVSESIYHPFDLAIVAVLIFVYASPLLLELLGAMPDETPEIGVGALVTTIGMQLFLTAMVIGVVAWRKHPVEWLGLRWGKWPVLFLTTPVVVALTYVVAAGLEMSGFNKWLLELTNAAGVQDVVQAFQETESDFVVVLLAVMAVIVAPITEEILFRGYMYPVAKKFAGKIPALLFSSLVFAMVHHSAMALAPLLFLAILLALVYELTGSIWAPIAGHMLFNGLTVAAQIGIRVGWIPGEA